MRDKILYGLGAVAILICWSRDIIHIMAASR